MQIERMVSEAYVVTLLRTFVALILLVAGIAKISNLRSFAGAVRAYGLLSGPLVSPVSRGLPIVEVLIAGALVLNQASAWPSLAAAALFLVFTGGVTINLLRGRRDISCGCFGTDHDRKLSWGLVMRNGLLILLALLGGLRAPVAGAEASLSGVERFATMLTAAAALGLWWLYGLISQMWRLRLPTAGFSGFSYQRQPRRLFSLVRAERR